MTGPHTVLDANTYWEQHYGEEFRFGQGTEHILAMLRRLPPAASWADLGSGSESLLWATALHVGRLTAVDTDPRRLAILTDFAAAARPRPAHRTALALSRRTEPGAFTARCRWLTAAVTADCLTGRPLSHPALGQGFDLVTQFGLLGLTAAPNTSCAASPPRTNSLPPAAGRPAPTGKPPTSPAAYGSPARSSSTPPSTAA